MLDPVFMNPAPSASSFLVIIVTRNDEKPLFSVDHCVLNQKMKAYRWLVTKLEEILDDLQDPKMVSTHDLLID